MDIKELLAKRANVWDSAKAIHDGAEAEDRVMNAEERERWDKLNDEVDTISARLVDQEKAETTRWDATPAGDRVHGGPSKAALSHIGTAQPHVEVADEVERHRLMDSYLRYGDRMMDPDDFRALRSMYRTASGPTYQNAQLTTSGPAGGYLVRETWRTSIIEACKNYGGMREVAEVIETSDGGPLHFLVADDTSNVGYILAEGQAASEASVTFGQRTLQAYMYTTGYVPVSFQLLQDSSIDIEAYLTRIFATRLGRITNQHFSTGTGVHQPQGIAFASTSGVTAANATALTADELIDLEHSVDPCYRGLPGTGWMFNDTTLRELKQLKDGEGRPLWLPGYALGEPPTVLGHRYIINQDVASMASGTSAVFFGDLSSYKIRDVRDMMVLRLEEIHALSAMVTFIAFSRHDGGLVNAGQNPVKHLTMAA